MILIKRIKSLATLNLREFDSTEEYFKKCDVDVRTCYRKCKKVGYEIKQYEEISSNVSLEIYDIWVSCDARQGRPINLNYETIDVKQVTILPERWPIEKYSGNLRFYTLEINSRIVAYLELYTGGDTDIVHSTLGHNDYLKSGIMKTLFYEVIKLKWNDINKLIYGPRVQMNYFKKDLLFK
jgi:hypothetical protein